MKTFKKAWCFIVVHCWNFAAYSHSELLCDRCRYHKHYGDYDTEPFTIHDWFWRHRWKLHHWWRNLISRFRKSNPPDDVPF